MKSQTTRGAHHQQRLDLGACAAAVLHRLYGHQARGDWPDQVDFAGLPAYGIACGQIDIGNAATDMTERMAAGILQADGSTKVEPRMDVAHVAQAVAAMARLPLDANVQFMTIMATNMPFVGRGWGGSPRSARASLRRRCDRQSRIRAARLAWRLLWRHEQLIAPSLRAWGPLALSLGEHLPGAGSR